MANKLSYFSDISGEFLGYSKTNFETYILPVDEYPQLRGVKDNVVLMSKLESKLYLTDKEAAKLDPSFTWIFNRAEALKRQYIRTQFKL
jgi:hypothetical protein